MRRTVLVLFSFTVLLCKQPGFPPLESSPSVKTVLLTSSVASSRGWKHDFPNKPPESSKIFALCSDVISLVVRISDKVEIR